MPGSGDGRAPGPLAHAAEESQGMMSPIVTSATAAEPFQLNRFFPARTKEGQRLIAKLELDKEILAESEPDPTESATVDPPSPAPKQGVPFFITQSQKVRLREQGYSDEQIAKMKPTEAHQILGLQ